MREQQTYRRGQMEQALWRWYQPGLRVGEPSKPFLTRIKRLLELDRAEKNGQKPASKIYAFLENTPKGQGTDLGYSGFNAFCLAIALDMLDAGFKQSEIVTFLEESRSLLMRAYKHAITHDVSLEKRYHSDDYPDLPYFEEGGKEWADFRIFLILDSVDPQSLLFRGAAATTIHKDPAVCHGIYALMDELHSMDGGMRHAYITELTSIARGVISQLENAPPVHRGRH